MPPPLPMPPESIPGQRITLIFDQIFSGNGKQIVPWYHFRIHRMEDGGQVGHINFRLGDSLHLKLVAGHIGYEIAENHRGHGFAEEACRTLAPFVESVLDDVIITANPDNTASLRIIEKLGATFLNEIDVPADDPSYARGARRKRRYKWRPGDC